MLKMHLKNYKVKYQLKWNNKWLNKDLLILKELLRFNKILGKIRKKLQVKWLKLTSKYKLLKIILKNRLCLKNNMDKKE